MSADASTTLRACLLPACLSCYGNCAGVCLPLLHMRSADNRQTLKAAHACWGPEPLQARCTWTTHLWTSSAAMLRTLCRPMLLSRRKSFGRGRRPGDDRRSEMTEPRSLSAGETSDCCAE